MVSWVIVNKLNFNSKKEKSWRKKHFSCRGWRIRIVKKKKNQEESEVKYLKCERKENPTNPGFFVEENCSSEVKEK